MSRPGFMVLTLRKLLYARDGNIDSFTTLPGFDAVHASPLQANVIYLKKVTVIENICKYLPAAHSSSVLNE